MPQPINRLGTEFTKPTQKTMDGNIQKDLSRRVLLNFNAVARGIAEDDILGKDI